MKVNELVDLLASYIAAGHGDADVLIDMTRIGEVAGTAADDLLSRRNWAVSSVGDSNDARDLFVVLDVEEEGR